MATTADAQRMAGQVSAALYGPGGVRDLLANDPHRLWEMDRTEIVVAVAPTQRDLDLAKTGPDQYLLGLYTADEVDGALIDPRIQLFASDILALDYDPVVVCLHELGHAWSYDHGSHCPDCMVRKQARPYVHRANCPVCEVHSNLAVAMALMDGLRMRSALEHVIPKGLGGTICEARWRVQQAIMLLPAAALAINDPQCTQYLARCLQQADAALSGWLDPDAVARAYAAVRVAWDAAYDCAHTYYARAVG